MQKERCYWTGNDPLMIKYHDEEWGVPIHNDIKLFEYIILDAFQAGLSWKTILHKRKNFWNAFDQFDVHKISNYSEKKILELLQNKEIIRNKLKINATINNAKAFLKIQKIYGSFDKYIWQFTDYKTINNALISHEKMIATSTESDAMSKDLKKRGFKFVGSTICYAFMQAAGMVNDHTINCFRYKEV